MDDPEIIKIQHQLRALEVEAWVPRIYDHYGFIIKIRRLRYCSKETFEKEIDAWKAARALATEKVF